MPNPPPKSLNITLLVLKLVVGGGAVLLDLAGKLTPHGSEVVITLLGALGITHVAALLRPAASSHDLVSKVSDVLTAVLAEVRADRLTYQPNPAASPASPEIPIVEVPPVVVARRPVPPAPVAPPPIGPLTAFAFAALGACGATATGGATPLDVASYNADILACSDHNSTRETIDACRAERKSRFCGRFPDSLKCSDGGAS